jgi:hypothetical protein
MSRFLHNDIIRKSKNKGAIPAAASVAELLHLIRAEVAGEPSKFVGREFACDIEGVLLVFALDVAARVTLGGGEGGEECEKEGKEESDDG